MSKKIKWENLHGYGFMRLAFSKDKKETYLITRGLNSTWRAQIFTGYNGPCKHYEPIKKLRAKTVKELKEKIQVYENTHHNIVED